MTVRQQLNITIIQGNENLYKVVYDKVFTDINIMECWEKLSKDIPRKYEHYSMELLAKVTELWVTIRGHSFVKGWNSKFERKSKRGTRKSLKPDKEPEK